MIAALTPPGEAFARPGLGFFDPVGLAVVIQGDLAQRGDGVVRAAVDGEAAASMRERAQGGGAAAHREMSGGIPCSGAAMANSPDRWHGRKVRRRPRAPPPANARPDRVRLGTVAAES